MSEVKDGKRSVCPQVSPSNPPTGEGQTVKGVPDSSRSQTDQQSPYQKWLADQNKPVTDADRMNAVKSGMQTADTGVKAGLVVTGLELGAVAAVAAAPAVATAATQTAATINTATLSAYVYSTTVLSAAGTMLSNAGSNLYNGLANAARAGQTAAFQIGVRLDTMMSGSGRLQGATDFLSAATPGGKTSNNAYGWAGRLFKQVFGLH